MIRRLRDLHEHHSLIDQATSPSGKCLVWTAATLLLVVLHGASSALMSVALGAVLILPDRRRLILSIAACGAVVQLSIGKYGVTGHALALSLVLVLIAVVATLLFSHLRRLPAPIRRHPVFAVHAATWVFLGIAFAVPELGSAVGNGISLYLWRMSYLAQFLSSPKRTERRLRDHLFYLLRPVFGGTAVPYGKGLAYLSKCEAREPTAVARSQLAGLKLLVLALAWTWLKHLMDAALYGDGDLDVFIGQIRALGLPHVDEILEPDRNVGRVLAWSVVYLDLIRRTLAIAVNGHVIVGSLRLLGFNVFRNTYKPLLAESIQEFWNRYYYYFKELLVEFFFYPTFLGLRRLPGPLRLLLAVFAAAFVGNMYYHVLSRADLILAADPVYLWEFWQPRLVYCLLLALGIWLSMIRRQRWGSPASPSRRLVRLRRISGVWTFFGLINIFNSESAAWTLEDGIALVRYLFGH